MSRVSLRLPDAMKHGGDHYRDRWIEAALNAPGPAADRDGRDFEPLPAIYIARGLADLAQKLPVIWPGRRDDPNRAFAVSFMEGTLAEAAKRLLLPELQS